MGFRCSYGILRDLGFGGLTMILQSAQCPHGSLRPSAYFVQGALRGGDMRPAQDGSESVTWRKTDDGRGAQTRMLRGP